MPPVEPGSRADVVVVGAGAAGLATARALARDGREPVVLEQHALPHDRGSSHGTSRIVRLAHDRADDVAEAVEALALWSELERSTGTTLLHRVGGLDFGTHLDETVTALSSAGVAHEVLSPGEVETRFPGVRAHGERAVHQADTAVARADRVLAALGEDARRHGARIHQAVAVTGLEIRHDSVRVSTRSGDLEGTLEAEAVVVAAGAWTGRLLGDVGIDLPLVATLQSPTYLSVPTAGLPTVIDLTPDGGSFYSLPEPGADLVKGGLHDPGPVVDLDGSREPVARDVERFADWVVHRYRDAERRPQRSSGCIYTWLPDSRFHLRRHDRVVVVSCCSGRGFKFTPLTGVRVARLVEEILGDGTARRRAAAPAAAGTPRRGTH